MTSTIGVKKIQYPNGTDIITLDSSGSLAIGNSATVGGTLGVTGQTVLGAASSPSLWSSSNNFIISDTSSDGGMAILSGTSGNGNIMFSDTTAGAFSDARGLITYLHASDDMRFMTANTEHMRIHSTGAVTKPLQPYFQVRSNGGNQTNTWEAGQVIKFQTVGVNQGSHYSTSTGRFTAPVAGFYQFNFNGFGYLHATGSVGTTTITVALNINGSNYIMVAYENNANGNTYPLLSGSASVYLNANDYAQIFVQSGGVYADTSNLYTAFSGHLVC